MSNDEIKVLSDETQIHPSQIVANITQFYLFSNFALEF